MKNKKNIYSLKKQNIKNIEKFMVNSYDDIRLITRIRQNFVREKFSEGLISTVLSSKRLEDYFSVDGSVKLKNKPNHKFFKKDGYYFYNAGEYKLRGPRYICSVNPCLEVGQKLRNLSFDFLYALDNLACYQHTDNLDDFLIQSSILDYLKNSAITMLNALVMPEKLGEIIENQEYEHHRKSMTKISMISVAAYYAHFYGQVDELKSMIDNLHSSSDNLKEATVYLVNQYRARIFSSRHFSRPEAGHPIIVLSFVTYVALTTKIVPDVIVGLPAGSTELSLAQLFAYKFLVGKIPEIILLPFSMHSIKHQFRNYKFDIQKHANLLSKYNHQIMCKNVMIIDDNSSTGKTIQNVYRLIQIYNPKTISAYVAEADVERSYIDIYNKNRSHIASSKLYEKSISILPVLKTIKPKFDLREMKEKMRLESYYYDKYTNSRSYSLKLVNLSFYRMVKEPTESVITDLDESNIVRSFRNTFLSNFYSVDVTCENVVYPSIEHAYQANKFTDSALARIKSTEVAEIEKILALRGRSYKIDTMQAFFADRSLSAGNVKVVADFLRSKGYVRKGWDNKKIELMSSLLIQKFLKPDIRAELVSTGNKYLLEENTWNDTLWGFCNGRGRNLLGHMLMVIRDNADLLILGKKL